MSHSERHRIEFRYHLDAICDSEDTVWSGLNFQRQLFLNVFKINLREMYNLNTNPTLESKST